MNKTSIQYHVSLGICLSTLLLIVPLARGQSIKGFFPASQSVQHQWEHSFLALPQPANFKDHLKEITKYPHFSGSVGTQHVIHYITQVMEKAGWDIQSYPYDVYLAPKPIKNTIEIVSPTSVPLNNQEYKIPGDIFTADTNATWGWNAYSGNGEIVREIVYANRGTREDFEQLKEWGISVKDKIVIARYGGNFRGYKAKYAEEYGAKGLIIFSDPEDSGYKKGLEYPDGAFGNESCIQRGSILTLPYTGDPLTPFEPALPLDSDYSPERLNPDSVDFPSIPVSPIPYGSAREIMKRMKGPIVSEKSWQGGLPFSYRLTGGAHLKVKLSVEQEKKFVRATNVIGMIRGSEFPDEWIILGCHHDAWAFGAIDPSSGTAVLLSLAEHLGKLMQQGFRPRRSILIAHWDAEEHGILGSSEWVEQFRETLQAKAVAYLNADAAVSGPNFGVAASPSLKQIIIDATRKVPYPGPSETVYEHWIARSFDASEPRIGNLGGGSDHVAFYTHVGVPSLSAGISGKNGVYHSLYDNFTWYSKFADKDFVYGPTMEKVLGIITMRLSQADLIPYDIPRYATDLGIHLKKIEDELKKSSSDYTFTLLWDAIEQLNKAGLIWQEQQEKLSHLPKLDSGQLSLLNSQLIGLEKSFIDPRGMDFGAWYRSLFASPDPFSGYASWMLPGLKYAVELNSFHALEEWETRYQQAILDLSRKVATLAHELEKP